eukprot:scaffold1210_cov123-Skeletonema_menzelii.AAC.4
MVLSAARHIQHKETFDHHNSGDDFHPLRRRAHVTISIKASFQSIQQKKSVQWRPILYMWAVYALNNRVWVS